MSALPTADEAAVRALVARHDAAIAAKDAAAAIACFGHAAVTYDLAPPLAMGPKAMRDPAGLEAWFATWEGPIELRLRDPTLRIADGLGYVFGLRHMTGVKVGGERVSLWYRWTACLAKRDGEWTIAHDHASVPFAMDGSGRALLDLEP